MKCDPVIFREYDIRGVYDEQFDLEFAEELGKAFITMVSRKQSIERPTVTIGHDARLTSPDIVESLTKGITSRGGKVLLLGLITTPMSYFSTFKIEEVSGSIMVTGSHNPPEYNGYKISVGKTTINGEEIQELRKMIEAKDYLGESQGSFEKFDINDIYVNHHAEEFGQLKDVPFVLDCGNGSAGAIVRKLYNAVGLNPIIMFEEPDGKFPNHHPDPTVEENLKDLVKKVQETDSLIGIGFDGDADRIGIVDKSGRMIYGDEMIAFIAKDILANSPGEKIIGDVKCSDRMYDDINERGGKAIMWKTGHSLIKQKVKEEKAPFGGELSGHVFFNDRNFGYDDAPYAGLRVVEILSKTGKEFSDLIELPPAFNTPELRIDTTEEIKHEIVAAVKKAFPEGGADYKVNLIDGIRLSFEDGWALVRASNTQPVIVLRFESTSESGLERIRDRVEEVVNPFLK